MRLCFATNNRHKLEEVINAAPESIQISGLAFFGITEELPETQNTFEGNALQKAQYVFDRLATPCFADDSGLEVTALNGAPGVYSARFAGPQRDDAQNISLLLERLSGTNDRRARFRTVIALLGFGPPRYFQGVVNGRITESVRGNSGFGYDPVFIPDGHSRTFAEMTLQEKNAISHRALAVRELVSFLKMAEARL